MKEIWATMASIMGVWAFGQSLLHTVIPPELLLAFRRFFQNMFSYYSSYCYYYINDIDGFYTNELYNAVQMYLSSFASTAGTHLSLTRGLNSSSITFGLYNNHRIIDCYKGATVEWEHVVTQRQSQGRLPEERRGFILRVRKKDKHLVLNSYLDFVTEKAKELRRKNQDRLLYTNSRGGSVDSRGYHQPWGSVPFKHPSTFDTLAMDPLRKSEIMVDLLDFANGESFYQKTGRAWKRGYLLYGPPGTGKSSMIAAMANYLGYDIYDLELTEVKTNSALRKLLMKTSSKSIIVIEDIDCSVNLTNREKSAATMYSKKGRNTISLSGLLNFTDGLWSCCGSERIFVFTTNHIEKLDPALLRSGRMDRHIHMTYCSFPALEILLKNYLSFEETDLDRQTAEAFPADISEVLIKNRHDKDKAVDELLDTLKSRAERNRSKSNVNVEDEEQGKWALETPKDGSHQLQETGIECDTEEDEDEDDDDHHHYDYDDYYDDDGEMQ